jgi:hypothetical protein
VAFADRRGLNLDQPMCRCGIRFREGSTKWRTKISGEFTDGCGKVPVTAAASTEPKSAPRKDYRDGATGSPGGE